MDPNTKLYVTNKGALLMKGGVLKAPGSQLLASDFKGIEANLETLLTAGNLSLNPVDAQGIDVVRGEQLPPLPIAKEGESIEADRLPRMVAGGDEQATIQRLKQIKEAQAAVKAAEDERQKLLADLVDAELTPEEARELGVI